MIAGTARSDTESCMAQTDLSIRRAVPADAAQLAAFAAATFEQAYGPHNRPEDTRAHIAAVYGVAQQTQELRDPNGITLIVCDGDRWAGYAQLRRSEAPQCVTVTDAIELGRFYVDGQWHGRGAAQLLMAAVCHVARDRGGRAIWLSAWERAPRALAFYAKAGFVEVGRGEFIVGEDRQSDRILMAQLPGVEMDDD